MKICLEISKREKFCILLFTFIKTNCKMKKTSKFPTTHSYVKFLCNIISFNLFHGLQQRFNYFHKQLNVHVTSVRTSGRFSLRRPESSRKTRRFPETRSNTISKNLYEIKLGRVPNCIFGLFRFRKATYAN